MIDIELKDENEYTDLSKKIKKCKSGIKHIKNDIDGINTDICILRWSALIIAIVLFAVGAYKAVDLQNQLDDANTKIESMQTIKSDISDLEISLDNLTDASSAHSRSIEALSKNQQYISKTVDNMKNGISKENSDE